MVELCSLCSRARVLGYIKAFKQHVHGGAVVGGVTSQQEGRKFASQQFQVVWMSLPWLLWFPPTVQKPALGQTDSKLPVSGRMNGVCDGLQMCVVAVFALCRFK